MRRRLLALLGLLLAACSDGSAPSEPGGPSLPARATGISQDDTPEQAAVAQVVPGFGGYFIDVRSGRPAVYLTDAAQRPAAEGALATFLSSRGFAPADLIVLPAEYDYLTLERWYGAARAEALAVEGAVFGDLDESRNRLRFGAVDATAGSAIRSVLAARGVPAGAATVEVAAPIQELATLQELVRPVKAGLQIAFFRTDQLDPADVSPLQSVCTLGFNAVKDGVASFVTNSHCTNARGGEEGTEYYQHTRRLINSDNPVNGGPNPRLIGIEAHDPRFIEGGACPMLRQCRYSDASRAVYQDTVPHTLGGIARTTTSYQYPPETGAVLVIDSINPLFQIGGVRARVVVGDVANKIGRTTGWTTGPVTQTCVDSNVLGTTVTMLCQDFVEAGAAGGDSGSPVFARPGNSPKVKLLGILWGGSVTADPPFFVFSRYSAIERELGSLVVH